MFLSCFTFHLFLLENLVHVITIIRPVLLNSLIDGYHGLYFDTESLIDYSLARVILSLYSIGLYAPECKIRTYCSNYCCIMVIPVKMNASWVLYIDYKINYFLKNYGS